MTIGELIFEVGFHADTMKLKDFSKAIGDLNMDSIIATTGYGALYEAAKKIITITDDLALSINKFTRETGQSSQEIQKWNEAADQMGVSAGTVAGAVSTLEDSIFKMKFTGENSNIWNMLGIDPTHTKDMFQVLSMLRDKLKGMSAEQQRYYLEKLGLSTELLNLINETDEEWSNTVKLQTDSVAQLKTASEFHKDMVTLLQQLNKSWENIAGVLMVPLDLLFKFLSLILGIVNGILSIPVGVFQFLANVILTIVDYIDNVLTTTTALFSLWRDISNIIAEIANFFKSIEESVKNIFKSINIFKVPALSPAGSSDQAPALSPVASLLREKLKGLNSEQQKASLEKFNIPVDQWDRILGKQKDSNQELRGIEERHKNILYMSNVLGEKVKEIGESFNPVLRGLSGMVEGLGSGIAKSFEFKNIMNGVRVITGDIINPWRSLQGGLGDLSNIIPPSSILNLHPETHGISPGNLAPSVPRENTNRESPKVTVNVKSTIKSNDPNTTVETFSDSESLHKTVRNIINQKPAGSG